MIRNGFDNLGQKSEPFSADHRLVLVSNFVGGNILDFSNRVSVSAENGATEKKSEIAIRTVFSILTFLSSFRPIQQRLKFDDLAILKLRHQIFCIFADVELRSGDLSHHN